MVKTADLPPFEAAAFRKALGNFATGVTIVTTNDAAGNPVGVTASSFNSVSLNPPLVLWSLAKAALSRPAFTESGHFAIHILTVSQEKLANRFAMSGTDKFRDLGWDEGQLGSPILRDHAAVFECAMRHEYDGGDHIIMVGEVVAFEARDEAPLLFHGGQYAERIVREAGTLPGNASATGSAADLIGATHAAVASGAIDPEELADVLDAATLAKLARLLS